VIIRVVVLKSEITTYMTQGHGKMQDGCHAWTLSYYCGGQREIFSLHCINITSFCNKPVQVITVTANVGLMKNWHVYKNDRLAVL